MSSSEESSTPGLSSSDVALASLSRAERFIELPDFIVYEREGSLALRYDPSAAGPGNKGFDIKLPHQTKVGEFESPVRVFRQKYGVAFLRSKVSDPPDFRPGRHPCGCREPIWERGSAEGFSLDLRSVAYRVAREREVEIRSGTLLIYCTAALDDAEPVLESQSETIVRRGDFCKVIGGQADREFSERLEQLALGLFSRNYPYGCSGAYPHTSYHWPLRFVTLIEAVERSSHDVIADELRYEEIVSAGR